MASRPARGAWVEIAIFSYWVDANKRRAPQGARGLKSVGLRGVRLPTLSRPARGAWVEIALSIASYPCTLSRAPQGARGLK